jgi:hypothetical protein
MARHKKISQSHLEENLKAKNRAKRPDSAAAGPVHQIVQRLSDNDLDAADPESIKELQQTLGNRVVSQLVSPGSGVAAVQREPVTSAVDDEPIVGSSSHIKSPGPMPGTPSAGAPPAPSPYPNPSPLPGATGATGKTSGAIAPITPGSSKIPGTTGDEPGMAGGLKSMGTSSMMPSHSPIVFDPSSSGATIQPPGSAEQEGTQPAQTPPPQQEEQEGA